jgi:hypothetical protein
MGLFSNNDAKELQQTQDIKEATTAQPTMPPSLNSTTEPQAPINSSSGMPEPNNNPQEQQFVNPFAQQQGGVQQSTPTPTMTEQPSPFTQQPEQNQQQQQMSSNLDEDMIKELIVENVEKIIGERWEKVTSSVESVVGWKDKIEREIDLLKHDIMSIKDGFEQFEKRLLNKVNSYDRNILDVNSEIKALEKVFNKITPTLVNNVNELSKIADNLRGVKSDTPEQK